MAVGLIINAQDVTKHTALAGNVDRDKIMQFIEIAQDIHIQNYTGTKLLNKIKTDIVAGTLTGVYLTLVTDYLKPMLIHWTMTEFLPFHAYIVSNGGVVKHVSENSETASKNEVDFLVEKSRSLAGFYSDLFVDYMTFNNASFPEYKLNIYNDITPKTDTNLGGWYL